MFPANKFKSLLLLLTLSLLLSACDYMPTWMGGRKEEKPKLVGERITVLPVATALRPDDSLKSVPVHLPAVTANVDWPQHTGMLTSDMGNLGGGGNFTKIEHTTVGDGNSFEHILVPRPVVGGGTVFAMDAVGYISAHDAAHISTRRWKSKGVAEKHEPALIGGGLAYHSGKLYATSGRGVVAAFDAATGKELWRKSIRIPFRSAPKVADGKLYAITIDNQLYAFNVLNGDILWTHRGMDETAGLLTTVSPTAVGGVVIAPYSSGELYALSGTDGKELWVNSLSMNKHTQANSVFSGIGGDPVVDGDVVFAVSNSGVLSTVQVASGQRIWDRPVASMNTPWIAGDYLYVLTSDNTLVCMVKYDGRVQWATKLQTYDDEEGKRRPITWKGPIMADGRLVIVGSYGQMLLISASDGKIIAKSPIADDIYTAPVIAGGVIYLVSQDATLYSLQ